MNDLVNMYFPELTMNAPEYESKYGILNVGLIRNSKVVTGYQWNYNYLDVVDMKIKYIHSYDLRILRRKVLDKGFEWIITDNREAINAYKLNNKLLDKRKGYVRKSNRKYRGSSGVKYVSKQHDKRYDGDYTWRYCYDGVLVSDKSLKCLKGKVLDAGGEWIVCDGDLYDRNISVEPFLKK